MSLRFFWHLLYTNWSINWGTVNLWSMFENWQIAVIKGKCRRFRNSSKCLNTHCAANYWPISTQKLQKEAQRCGLQISLTYISKIFRCAGTVGCQKFIHYIFMLFSLDVLFWTVLYMRMMVKDYLNRKYCTATPT